MSIYYIEESCQIKALPDIYQSVFGEKIDGTFVEVGAYDGRMWSNTWCLAELGWYGLYIEPIPKPYERCVGNHKDHPNVKVVNICVGDGKPYTMYYKGDLYSLSNVYKDNEQMLLFREYDTVTLDSILRDNNITKIDLLVIDVEGAEEIVLRGFSLEFYLPTMIIIESHRTHDDLWKRLNVELIDQYLGKHYRMIYTDHINDIFLSRQV